jgi:hypothetical protein
MGGCVGPKAGLDAVVKRKLQSPCREHPIIQPVAQRYTSELSGSFAYEIVDKGKK